MVMAEIEAPQDGARYRPMKIDWLHAIRSLRRLLADKEDTTQVFEIMRALNGRSIVRAYRRLLTTREGGRLAYERPEFADRLMDDAWLDSLPAGSVGAAYRDFVRAQRLSADGLAEVSRKGLAAIDDPHPYAWFGRRIRDAHDVWHVLSGYGRDGLGEACLTGFSFAQTKGPGWALIAIGAAAKSRRAGRHPCGRAIAEGYRRGRAARWLPAEDYEQLMAEPLDEARRRLNIKPPAIYESIPPEARDAALGSR